MASGWPSGQTFSWNINDNFVVAASSHGRGLLRVAGGQSKRRSQKDVGRALRRIEFVFLVALIAIVVAVRLSSRESVVDRVQQPQLMRLPYFPGPLSASWQAGAKRSTISNEGKAKLTSR